MFSIYKATTEVAKLGVYIEDVKDLGITIKMKHCRNDAGANSVDPDQTAP